MSLKRDPISLCLHTGGVAGEARGSLQLPIPFCVMGGEETPDPAGGGGWEVAQGPDARPAEPRGEPHGWTSDDDQPR